MRQWVTLIREVASLGVTVLVIARANLDDRASARKIARLTALVDEALTQTDADLCDEATLLILDLEAMLAEAWEIDQLEALYRQPCRRGRV